MGENQVCCMFMGSNLRGIQADFSHYQALSRTGRLLYCERSVRSASDY